MLQYCWERVKSFEPPLFERGKNGLLSTRVLVPKPHQAAVGREQIWFATGTTDRATASKLARRFVADWEQKFGRMEAGQNPDCTPKESLRAAAVALKFRDQIIEKLEEDRRALPDEDSVQEELITKRVLEMRRLTRHFSDGELGPWEAMATRAIAKGGLPIQPQTPEFYELVDALAKFTMDGLATWVSMRTGDVEAQPRSKSVREEIERTADKAKVGETIVELFDRYAVKCRDERSKRPETLAKDRRVIQQFADFVGRDRSIYSITSRDVGEYRNTLRTLPPMWTMRRDMRDLTMREAAKLAKASNFPQTALNTVNKALSTISPLYNWLIEEQWELRNPCTGLFYRGAKGKNPRPPFGTERLNKIFGSPLFTGFVSDGCEHKPGDQFADDWRFWIPVVMLFTGIRVGEAAQLRTDDITFNDKQQVWVIDIRHEPTRGQTTKSGKSRITLAHRKLVELGFVGFVEMRRAQTPAETTAPLFPEVNRDDQHQIGSKPSEFWRDYLTRIGLKQSRDGLGAHSFRHELADRLRDEAGLPDDSVAVALGHDQKSTTGGYGNVRQGTVKFLKPIFDAVTFDGVILEHIDRGAHANGHSRR